MSEPSRSTMDYLAAPRRGSKIAWIVAAAIVLLGHVGLGAFVVARWRLGDLAPELGTQADEIDVEMTSPREDPVDLPPGPEADEAAASPAAPQQRTRDEETVLPKDIPDEMLDATLLKRPRVPEKPKETDTLSAPSKGSTPSVASEAAAPPMVKTAQEAARSAAPAPGLSDSARRIRASWQRELVAYLNRHKRYPAGANARDAEIVVAFTLDRDGHVLSEHVVKGSGAPLFDRAALDMVRRSSPVPPPPPLAAELGLNFTVPVLFEPRGRM